MAELVNASKLAQILGVSRTAISKAVGSGRLAPIHTDESGKMLFDLATAQAAWADRPNPRPTRKEMGESAAAGVQDKHVRPAGQGHEERILTGNQKLVMTKIARESYTAALKRMDVEERKGILISVDLVKEQGRALGEILLAGLQALPARLYQQLAIMTDPFEIQELLRSEIELLLVSVREYCGVSEADVNAELVEKFKDGKGGCNGDE